MDCSRALRVKVNLTPVASLTLTRTGVSYPLSGNVVDPGTSDFDDAAGVYTAKISYSSSTTEQALTAAGWQDFFIN